MIDEDLLREGQSTTSETPGSMSKREWLFLAALLLVAMELRILCLRNEAAWLDEITTLEHLSSPTLKEFLSRCQEINPWPPVYMVAEYLWGCVAGISVLSQRVLSVIFGIGSLAGLYGLSRALFGARAALVAAVWAAFMPWHIYYSQEIRFYALVTFLSALSMWTFACMVERGTYRWIIAHAAINWFVAWTHPLTVFLFCAEGVFLLVFRRTKLRLLGKWMATHVPLGISLYVFQARSDWSKIHELESWIPMPRLAGAPPSVAGFLSEAGGAAGVYGVPGWVPFTAWGRAFAPCFGVTGWALLAVAGVAWLSALRAALNPKESPSEAGNARLRGTEKIALLALIFVLPPLATFVASFVWRPIFLDRYLIYAMLPLYVVVGRFVASQRSAWIAMALLSLPVFSYFAFYFPGPSRIPYDQMTATMRASGAQRPDVFVADGVDVRAIEFYSAGFDPQIHPANSPEQPFSGRVQPLAECWFVVSQNQLGNLRTLLAQVGGGYTVWEFPSERPVALVRWNSRVSR